MHIKLQTLLRHPFIRGSSLNFLGSLGVNFLSYLFNIVIGRFLGPSLYSEYFSLVSIWYLASMPSSVLQTVITKQIAHYFGLSHQANMLESLKIGLRYVLICATIIVTCLIIASPQIFATLKITDPLSLVLIIILIFTSYISVPFLSYFVAKEKYLTFSLLSGLGIFGRLIFVIPFLTFANNVTSVLLAMLFGLLFQTLFIALKMQKELVSSRKLFPRIRGYLFQLARSQTTASQINQQILHTLRTTFIATLGLAMLTQSDILVARARLSEIDAGLYASLAVTGKIIPFFTLPLIGVLLPQITAKLARGEEYKSTIKLAAILVGAGSGAVALFYAIFPTFVISIFLGSAYLSSAPYLGHFSLFQMLFSLVSLGVMASIAINNYKAASVVLLAALIQLICLLILPTSISSIITISIISVVLAVFYYTYILFTTDN